MQTTIMSPTSYRGLLSSIGILMLGGLSACGPGAAAGKVRPADPTASSALGEPGGACRQVEKRGEPLVVDWKPEQRGDLEEMMHDGVAVVSYSCSGIKLLKECKLDGSYGYLGMTKREQVVRLESSDEIRANLPTMGGGLAAKIGGELSRGSTIDVAMVMVGKRRTTWKDPTVDDLKGSCEGATHFVRGALVGAFVMETGTKAKVRAAAEILGAGTEAGSSSDKSTRNQEGDPKDCAGSSPDSAKPPAQCGAAVRLEMIAIGPSAKGKEPTKPAAPPPETMVSKVEAPEQACPKGLVLTEGKCAEAATAKTFLCDAGNAAQCTEQCGKGNPGSCASIAAMHADGNGAAKDAAKAFTFFKQACDGGEMRGCVGQARALVSGSGTGKDAKAAQPLFTKACAEGVAAGCGGLGALLASGEAGAKDEKAAAAVLQKACDGGDDAGCGLLGDMLLEGRGVAADKTKAGTFLGRACQGGQMGACEKAGRVREANLDFVGAGFLYMRACNAFVPAACTSLARLQAGGKMMPESDAKRNFETACNFGRDSLACAAVKVSYGGSMPVIDVQRSQELQRSCDAGVARDCTASAIFDLASGMKQVGMSKLDRACMMGDGWACSLKKTVKLAFLTNEAGETTCSVIRRRLARPRFEGPREALLVFEADARGDFFDGEP
jgi:hypothetical protein